MAMAAKLPGLQRAESGRFDAALDGGDVGFYRIAVLEFADEAALQAALDSDQGKAVAADYGNIAPQGSRLLRAVVDE
jgi:uncharacterized protein (TIGR02118 family)